MNRVSEKKKEKKNNIFKILLIIIMILIILSGVRFGIRVYQNGGGLQGVLSAILGQTPETLENLDTINVLVMGVSEDLGSKLTDTIILCSYNPKQQTASMLSIPRDTFVGKNKATAKGSDKINSLYSMGVEKTLKAVSEITGLEVNNYVVVNTDALIKIVDIIGGVEFDVPIDMDYDDPTQDLHIHLKSGMQTIDGEKAEQLLRFRHNNNGSSYPTSYGDNDFGRMRTQREFMTETAKQTLKFKNITKVKNLLKTAFENVETNLNMDEALQYVPYIVNFDTANIDSEQLPGVSEKCNELWFFVYNKKETTALIEEMKNKIEGIIVEDEEINEVSNTTIKNKTSNTANTTNTNKTTNATKNTSKENKISNSSKNTSTSSKSTNSSKNTITSNKISNSLKK